MQSMWFNTTTSPFLLTGFPGMEKAHHLISIPLLVAYISILLGNGTLLFLIRDDHNLHEPMYYFLAMLAATDLGVTLTTMPTVLGVLWLNHREIGHGACFSQAYFIHTLSIVESGVLLAMAYDRFIAIRNPLRYAFILTDTQVIKIGVGVLARAGLSIMPIIIRLYWLPYCRSHILSHAFCLHQDVIKLACADITFNHLYPVVVVFAIGLLDFLVIFFSYILILKTVMGIASRDERAKALNTCVSHICCILVFYVSVAGLTFIHRFGKHVPHVVHVTMSYICFLFPPFMNPVIYSIKTKQIQIGIFHLFSLPCPKARLIAV
ncbi:olfactory receptor 51B6-like [Marmota marmota marmota]|uniref:Olfactory receptor n=1 Tax=Marmota marmota marmota TaxID=9994 RepID=A0A8C5ZKX3_MARMA|nr:olfactory receptor 51B6-like [Marmota marmota marmota]